MDVERFDALTRFLTTGGSRRHALGRLLLGSLGLLGWQSAEDAEAHDISGKCKKKSGKQKKKCLKKAKKHNAEHAAQPAPLHGAGVECGLRQRRAVLLRVLR